MFLKKYIFLFWVAVSPPCYFRVMWAGGGNTSNNNNIDSNYRRNISSNINSNNISNINIIYYLIQIMLIIILLFGDHNIAGGGDC